MQAAAEARYEMVDISKIDASEDINPRFSPPAEAYAELQASIAERGIESPLLLRPAEGGRFDIVAGERRWRSALALGHAAVPAIIREMTDKEAAEACQIENFSRASLTPVEEARGFANMARHGSTVDEIARAVGALPRTIHRRLAILELPAAFLEEASTPGSAVSRWPPELYDELTRFPKEQRGRACACILEDGGSPAGFAADAVPTPKALRDMLTESLTETLKGAQWDMDDAELVPDAGPCSSCPYRASDAQGGLFDDEDVKANTCLNSACFQEKAMAFRVREVVRLKEKYPEALILCNEYRLRTMPEPMMAALKKAGIDPKKFASDHAYGRGGKDDLPAIEVFPGQDRPGELSGKKLQLIRVKKYSFASGGTASPAKPAGPKPMKEREAQLALRRAKSVAIAASLAVEGTTGKAWAGRLAQLKPFEAEMAAAVRSEWDRFLSEADEGTFAATLIAYGVERIAKIEGDKVHTDSWQLRGKVCPDDVVAAYGRCSTPVRKEVRRVALGRPVSLYLAPGNAMTPEAALKPVRDLFPGLLAGMIAAAAVGLPEPKGWEAQRESEKAQKKAAKKGKGQKAKASPAPVETLGEADEPEPGVCRICGCEEHSPCIDKHGDACAWADDTQTLCTNPKCVKAAAKQAKARRKTAGVEE